MDTDALVDDSNDYLLDPELWSDQLPQPFLMIDEVLQGFLDEVWELIESREVARRQEEARVRIPSLESQQRLEESLGATTISAHNGVVYLGTPSELAVLELKSEQWRRVTEYQWSSAPFSLTAGDGGSVQLIAALFKEEVKLFAYSKQHLIHLKDISSTDEESTITKVTAPTSWTHLTITTTHADSGTKLQLYRFPLLSWATEVERHLVAMCEDSGSKVSVASRGSKYQHQDVVFSAPVLLYSLQPPSSLTPCPATDPATALSRVEEDSTPASCIPTGQLHCLTEAYLKARRKAFVAQRADFVQENRERLNYTMSSPNCHYLYYKSYSKQASPYQLVVWWSAHNQLLVYPIPDSAQKTTPPPVKLFPQAAPIVSSACDQDGRYLALGLTNGIVLIWDMSTVLCSSPVRPVREKDTLSVMMFAGLQLVVGSESGRVSVVNPHEHTAVSLAHRMSKQREAYPQLFQGSGYSTDSKVVELHCDREAMPSVVFSVHENGEVVLWSVREEEALCKVSLLGVSEAQGGRCAVYRGWLFVVEISDGDTPSIILYDLHGSPTLTQHWVTSSTPSRVSDNKLTPNRGMTNAIENYLSQYNQNRLLQLNKDKERWNKQSYHKYQYLLDKL